MTRDEHNAEGDEDLSELVEYGADVSGNLIGAGAGFLIAGPVGAGVGAFLGPGAGRAFRWVASELKRRVLGPREEERIAVVLALADQKLRQGEAEGREVRDDGFFDQSPVERSAGAELIEGVVLAAQREAEERKLPFISNLLANLTLTTEYDRPAAVLLVRLGRELSYQQLCLLSLFNQKSRFTLRAADYRGHGHFSVPLISALQETLDLYHRGLLNAGGEALLGLPDVKPAQMGLQGLGVALYLLMELGSVPEQHLQPLAGALAEPPSI